MRELKELRRFSDELGHGPPLTLPQALALTLTTDPSLDPSPNLSPSPTLTQPPTLNRHELPCMLRVLLRGFEPEPSP